MNPIHRSCLSAVAAAVVLAAGLSASQAFVPAPAASLRSVGDAPVVLVQGYDTDGIAIARGTYRDPNRGYYPYNRGYYPHYGAPVAGPYAYGYCPLEMVPVRLRNGRVVWRWRPVC